MRQRWSWTPCTRRSRYRIESSLFGNMSKLYCIAFVMCVRTLVLSSAVDNQLNAVVCLVGSKTGVRSPVIAASVVDALDDGVNRYTVG